MKSLVFILLLLTVYTQGEKKPRTEADYRSRTLRELTDTHSKVHADLLPSRVKVLYDGKTRPLVENKKHVITSWANQYAGAPEFYTRPYQTEMLFTEDGESYWLAVRKDSLPRFEQEFKKGDAIELFLIKMGNAHIDDKLEPVLLVEKFSKP